MSSYHFTVLHDIRTMDEAALAAKYDLEIDEGSVYDIVEDREFASLAAWADFIYEQEQRDAEEYEYFAHKTGMYDGEDD
jgi:hypothetical protein